MIRRVGMKRVSTVSRDGQLTWQMREVTKLACPGLDVPATAGTDASVSTETMTEGGTTNKKMRFTRRGDGPITAEQELI